MTWRINEKTMFDDEQSRIAYPKRGLILIIIGFSALSFWSCRASSEAEAQQAPCIAERIDFEKLDAATKKRLKDEAEVIVRAEIQAQMQRELEAMHLQKMAEAEMGEGGYPKSASNKDVDPELEEERDRVQTIDRDPDGLKILRLLLSTDVVRRLPVDERETFTIDDGSVFCFTEISAPRDDERMITLRFTHSTGLTQSYALPVNKSPAWRTWSKLNLTRSMTGQWFCEILNEDGMLLARRSFEVVDNG